MPSMKALSLIIQRLWPMLKFFSKVGQRSRSKRSHVQNLWYRWKGLVIRITHAKYERPISKGKKVIANIKVFWRTDRRTDGQTDRRTDRVITIGHPPSGGALIKPICLYEGYMTSIVKITPMWNVFPTFLRNFPPAKITFTLIGFWHLIRNINIFPEKT